MLQWLWNQKKQVTVPDLRPVLTKGQNFALTVFATEMSLLPKVDLQGLTCKATILQQYINI